MRLRLQQERELGRERLECKRKHLEQERERLIMEQQSLSLQRKAEFDTRLLELEFNREMHAEIINMKAKKMESDERIARLQIESKERIFDKISEQTERHHRERIAHEREENNKNRNLMTYNVHVRTWTKKCMVQCFGTLSRWGMSSEHIVQAAEFNRDEGVSDGDMEKFVEAIAAGSAPMRLVDGSTKIVMDNNILPILHDISERKNVTLSAQDEIKIRELNNVSLKDIVDKLAGLNVLHDAATNTGEDNYYFDGEGTDSTPSETDEPQCEEDEEDGDNEAAAEEKVEEIDEFDDINPMTSKYVRSLFKRITDVIRSDGEIKRNVLVCAFANIDGIDSVLRGDKSVMARLVKWRDHCTTELATRSSIRSRTEVMRDDKNLRLDRRKSMIKDITQLMKKANDYHAEQGTFRCFVCRKLMHINDYDVERLHVVSRADGGDCSIGNLVPGCLKCNRSSGRVNPIDVRA
ncbi:hypothetical protein L917_21571 [Phytophthora nicotianae]|nr:hypothetical protein L917_21571 [Phytophthora nicotianae]